MRTLSILVALVCLSILSLAKPLPVVYITGTASVCPGQAYTYSLYTNGCTINSYSWNIIGGIITTAPGGGGGGGDPVSRTAIAASSVTTGVFTTVTIMWTAAGTKSVMASISVDCGQTDAGLIGGPITFEVPGLKPSTPSAPAITNSSSSYCAGDNISLTTSVSENTNTNVSDDVSVIWEVSINGGSFLGIDNGTTGTINYMVPNITPIANGYSTLRFRVSKYYIKCGTYTMSDKSSQSAAALVYAIAPAPTISTTNRICSTQSTVTIDVSGNANKFFIQLNPSANYIPTSFNVPFVISDLAPGTYNYQFFYWDAINNAHLPCGYSGSFTIGNGDYTLDVSGTPTSETCFGLNDGKVGLSILNGLSPYTFSWLKDSSAISKNSQIITDLSPGNYSAAVRDSHGCTGSTNPSIPVVAATKISVSASIGSDYNGLDVTCHGASDGKIVVFASGGTGAFKYSSDGVYYQDNINVLSGLSTGNYSIYVKDGNECLSQSQNTIHIVDATSLIAGNVVVTNPSCFNYNNGSVNITGTSGGTGIGTYQYSAKDNNSNTVNLQALMASTSGSTYTISIKDANGCSVSFSETLTSPAPIVINTLVESANCTGWSDGRVTINIVSGGIGDFQFTADPLSPLSYQASNIITGLGKGSYTVTAKDDHQCTGSKFVFVDEKQITGNVTQTTQILCHGDTGVKGAALDLTPSGGTPDAGTYVYDWTKSGATIATTQDVSGIPAGTYSVTITDKKLCSTTLPNIVVSQPALLTSSISKTDVSCNPAHGVALSSNGAINLTPAGGTTPYQYAWSSNNVSQDLSGLVAGTYSVTITDNNGCVANNTATLLQPAAVVSSIGLSSDVTCKGLNNGSITIAATGGTSVFSYSKNGTSWQASPVFSSLPPTSYTIITKDQNGCTSQLTQAIAEPNALVATISDIVNTTCGNTNGSAQVNVTGGNGNYQYAWKNTFNQTVSTASVLSNASGDAYTVTVTDSKNCSDNKAALISNSDGAIISISSIDPTTCYDSHDGKAVITVSSGLAPYAITWSNEETGLTPAALLPGDNIVRVSDANNCVAVKLVAVPFPDAIAVDTKIITPPSCFSSTDAGIALTMKGGNGNYSYAWSNGPITSSITNVAAGDYGITVKDSKNCTYTSSIKIDAIPELKLSVINEKLPTCFDGSDGALTVGTTGGNGTYSYQWTDGPATPQIENIKAGSYTIKVTDMKGCNLSSSFTLNNPVRFTISIDDKTICVGQKYKIASDVTNGSYTWTSTKGFNSAQREVSLTDPDTYTLKVVNAQGCTAQDSFELKTSTDLLHADLLMISEAYQADTVVVIDLSWPLPDAVTWLFPTQASVVEQNNDLGYAFLKFNKTGQYDVAIRANLGECVDTYSQAILIKEGGVTNSGGRQSTINVIQYFEVHPNPNKGDFRILAELSEAQPVKLMLVNTEGNKILINQYDDGKDNYSWDFSIPDLIQGTYFLVLKAGKETKAIRMMKL